MLQCPGDRPLRLEKHYRHFVSVENEHGSGGQRQLGKIDFVGLILLAAPSCEAVVEIISQDVHAILCFQTVFENFELQNADHAHDVGLGTDARLLIELDGTFFRELLDALQDAIDHADIDALARVRQQKRGL